MTAPAPPPAPGGPGQQITVTPENVLAARRVIGEAADRAKQQLNDLMFAMQVTPPAFDDISKAAAVAWNRNLAGESHSHYRRLLQYVESVQRLGDQLEEVAKQYGIDDEEIAASFQHSGRQM